MSNAIHIRRRPVRLPRLDRAGWWLVAVGAVGVAVVALVLGGGGGW